MGHSKPSDKQTRKDRGTLQAILEIPSSTGIAVFGFLVEFLYELPFMAICLLHEGTKKGRNRKG
jgi:hypothetical protein